LELPLLDRGVGTRSDALVEHIADGFFVAGEQRHDYVVGLLRWEPGDQTNCDIWVERMRNPPDLVLAELPYSFDGWGVLLWFAVQVLQYASPART